MPTKDTCFSLVADTVGRNGSVFMNSVSGQGTSAPSAANTELLKLNGTRFVSRLATAI